MPYLRIFLSFLVLGWVLSIPQAFAEVPKPEKPRTPLEIFENGPLVFGTVLAIRQPSKIIVYPNGQRKIIGDVDLKPNDLYSPARLSITGDRNSQVNVSLDPMISLWPTSATHKTTTTPAKVKNFVLFSSKISQISDVARLNYFGMDTVFIGATLSLSPESPAGTYTLKLSPVLEYRSTNKTPVTLP